MKIQVYLACAFLTIIGIPIAQAQNTQAKQTPPVKMGTSGGSAADISKAFCCGGTLGALVLIDGQPAILSNNHILARSGSGTAGEDTIQPGLIDVGCRASGANVVGDFAGNFVPFGTANVDAAVAYARAGMVDSTGYILNIGVPCSQTVAPAVGTSVLKSGRTTGLTSGQITSVNTSVSIQYQRGCNSGKKFVISYQNQIVTGAMSAGGDSGSLLLTSSLNPVGLLFAGSSSTTIYNPINDVVNAFQAAGHSLSFVGNSCAPAASATTTTASGINTTFSPQFGRALQTKVENEHALMNHPGVWGVGVGAAENDPGEPAIVVYLESPGRAVPPSIPQEIDGTKVRVIFTDPIVAQ